MPAFQQYASELRQDLPVAVYRPVLGRLLWLPVHLALIAVAIAGVVLGPLHPAYALLMSLVIGHSYACLALLAHEILHGTVVRSRFCQDLLGGLCFLPHCLPPDLWRTWHNRFHHGYTGIKGKDPDGFGDPVLYRRSRLLHTILTFLPGSGYLRSATYFLFYFSFHVLFVLFLHSRKYDYWSERKWRKQCAIFALEVCWWTGVLVAVGPRAFLFIYVLPLMIANTVQMTYVTTNHWLCDGTGQENDPLRNSLSVKLPRIVDWLHLNASYHTEHHLGPSINPHFAPRIHDAMTARYGDRCRRLSLPRILLMTYRTPRVHLGEQELVDIRNGNVFSTLGPRGESPELIGRVAVPVRGRRSRVVNGDPSAGRALGPASSRQDAVAPDEPTISVPFPEKSSRAEKAPRRKAA